MQAVPGKTKTGFNWRGGATAIVAAVVFSTPFWGNTQAADKDGSKPMASMEMPKSMKGGKDMEMHMSMMKGMKEMEAMQSSGDPDYDFAMMMRMHHQSALDMANVELKYGKDAKLLSMAKDIIKSQQKEIKEFDKWLAKHRQPMSQPMSKAK